MLNKDPESGRKSQCLQPGQCLSCGTMIGHGGGHKTGCDCRQQLPSSNGSSLDHHALSHVYHVAQHSDKAARGQEIRGWCVKA